MSSFINDTQIAGSGNIIGPTMENIGHFLQSELIVALVQGPANALSFLLYFASLFVAILIVALGGQYKYWNWFLIGPPLFYLCFYVTVESPGVDWNFGAASKNIAPVERIVDNVLNKDLKVARVSWVFLKWTEFSEGIVQVLVETIKSSKLIEEGGDLSILDKALRYHDVFNLGIEDKTVSAFVNQILFGLCSEYLSVQMSFAEDHSFFEEDIFLQRLAEIDSEIVLGRNDSKYKFITMAKEEGFLSVDIELKNQYKCSDLWALTIKVLVQYASHSVSSKIIESNPKERQKQILKELADKFVEEDKQAVGSGFYGPSTTGACGENDHECIGDRVVKMINAIAINMLSTEMSGIEPGTLGLNPRQYLEKGDDGKYYDVDTQMRRQAKSYEYERKGEFLTFLLGLPYIQGLAFSALSFMFPIFCFTLLIPGKHLGLITWGSLWFWVDLWTVSFAIVMVADKILYGLLPPGAAMTDQIMSEPVAAFRLILQADSAYSVKGYYTVLAGLMAFAPFAFSWVVSRGTSEVTNIISRAYNDFGGPVGLAFAKYARHEMAQRAYKKVNLRKERAGLMAFSKIINKGSHSINRKDGSSTTTNPLKEFAKIYESAGTEGKEELAELSHAARIYSESYKGGSAGLSVWEKRNLTRQTQILQKHHSVAMRAYAKEAAKRHTGAAGDASAKYEFKVFFAHVKAEVQSAIIKASVSDPVIQDLNAAAVGFGFANHAFNNRISVRHIVDRMLVATNLGIIDATSDAFDRSAAGILDRFTSIGRGR